MYRPTLNLAPNGLSNFPDTSSLASGSSGQAFSRYVVNGASKNHLQQATVLFHNPFNNPSLRKRPIKIVYGNLEKDQSLDLTVRKEPLCRNQQAPTYNPENESFSIHSLLGLEQSTPQSSLVVDNDLHQPGQLSNQDGIGTFSTPELPTVSDELRYTKLNARTVTHPPLQGASCGETSVNFSQPPSCSVAIFSPLNTGIQQQVTNATAKIERLESIVISESLAITSGVAYRRDCSLAYQREYNKAYRAELLESRDENKARQAGQTAGKAAKDNVKKTFGFGESLPLTSIEVYQRDYKRAYQRDYQSAYRAIFRSSGDIKTAQQAGKAAGKAASQAARNRAEKPYAFGSGKSLTIKPKDAYNKAYSKACRAELLISGDENKAKQAGQTAGKAASKAARNRAKKSSDFGSGELPPPSRFSVVKRKEYLQSRSNPSHPE